MSLPNIRKLLKSLTENDFGPIGTVIEDVSKKMDSMNRDGGNTSEMNSLFALINTMKENLTKIDDNTSASDTLPSDSDGMFTKYNRRLKNGLLELSNPDKLARLKHDIELETKYIDVLNGKGDVHVSPNPSGSPQCPCPGPAAQPTTNSSNNTNRASNTNGELTPEGIQKFKTILEDDIKRQQNIHLVSLQLDQLLKMVYLHQETELLDNMLEQQNALVRGLSDWSDYLDQQTHEYAEMYEKMDALISTQRRKSSFTVRDIQSLEKWTYGSRVMFWILIAFGVFMVIVNNFTSIQTVAHSVDKSLNNLRKVN